MKKKIIIIIPARKKSQRVKNKNLRLIGGIHLIEHTLLFSEKLKKKLNNKYDVDIFFSTDSPKLKYISKKYNNTNYLSRPSNLADHISSNFDVVLDIINHFPDRKYDCLLLLQPTSPFRSISSVTNAISDYFNNFCKQCIFSVSRLDNPNYHFIVNNKKKTKFLDLNDQLFRVNGNFYIANPSLLNKNKSFISNNSIHYFTNNTFESVDIDTLEDLNKAINLYETFKKKIY